MKKFLSLLLFMQVAYLAQGQSESGKVIYDRLYSAALENPGGEDPTRSVNIYLPPDYDKTNDKCPVIYYLHGITQQDSSTMAYRGINKLLDKAITTGKIKPVIFVMSNQYALYTHSWQTLN